MIDAIRVFFPAYLLLAIVVINPWMILILQTSGPEATRSVLTSSRIF